MDWTGFGDTDGFGTDPADDALLFRNSYATSMELCPARQGYLLAGKATQVVSEAMSFGTMIHAHCEAVIASAGTHMSTRQWLLDQWNASLERDKQDFTVEEMLSPEALDVKMNEAITAVALWDRHVYPQLGYGADVLVEETMRTPIGRLPNGREVWVFGTPDAVDLQAHRIDDWKTAARGWDVSKAHATGQLAMYSFLVQATRGVYIDRGTYWVWNRAQSEWVSHDTTRTPSQVDAYLRNVWQQCRVIDSGAFTFNPWQSTFGKYKRGWWCGAKYCAAWDVCEGKHIADDVWEEQQIEITAGWT